MRRLTLASLALTFLALTACKSGYGEHCQVNADCEEGLACVIITTGDNRSAQCRDDFEQGADAAVDAAIDASEIDGPSPDAPDAAPDAAVDAPPDA